MPSIYGFLYVKKQKNYKLSKFEVWKKFSRLSHCVPYTSMGSFSMFWRTSTLQPFDLQTRRTYLKRSKTLLKTYFWFIRLTIFLERFYSLKVSPFTWVLFTRGVTFIWQNCIFYLLSFFLTLAMWKKSQIKH